jgi:hypothetical protein
MNIYEALKSETDDIRLTNSAKDRWLVWDDAINQWVVYQKKRYERMTGTLYHGDSCDEAISVLMSEYKDGELNG